MNCELVVDGTRISVLCVRLQGFPGSANFWRLLCDRRCRALARSPIADAESGGDCRSLERPSTSIGLCQHAVLALRFEIWLGNE
jgi:hypothetical protein